MNPQVIGSPGGNEITSRIYTYKLNTVGANGRLPVNWDQIFKEHLREGEVRGLECARIECMERNR